MTPYRIHWQGVPGREVRIHPEEPGSPIHRRRGDSAVPGRGHGGGCGLTTTGAHPTLVTQGHPVQPTFYYLGSEYPITGINALPEPAHGPRDACRTREFAGRAVAVTCSSSYSAQLIACHARLRTAPLQGWSEGQTAPPAPEPSAQNHRPEPSAPG